MKQHPVLFYVLLFHDLNHHPGTQLKAALKQKALGHGLMLSHGICIPEEQVLLFIRHGDQKFSFIPDNQVPDFSMADTPYPDLSHV